MGKRTDMVWTGLRGLLWLLGNLLLFMPRRKVTVTVEVVRRSDLPGLSRETLNPYLENWYNQGGPETPVFVPYHFLFGPRTREFPAFQRTAALEFGKIKPATVRAVNEIVEEHLGRPLEANEKRPETTLDAIGLDSLQRMDTALQIEDRFGFRTDRVAETLQELWALAEGLFPASSEAALNVPEAWGRPPSDCQPAKILADTLAEAFVRRALAHPDDVALADRLSGVLSYRRLLVGVKLLSARMREISDDAIGVMLPASVAADTVLFALQMAGKLPVMLNWTTGPAALAHAVGKLRATRVITSRKLIDRLGIEVPGAEYVFLEDLRGGIGKLEVAAALAATYLAPGRFLRAVPRANVDDPAVVLFTSGSETAPKAVPLSHRNLLTNARDSLSAAAATRGDAMLACLPPFHSFGLTGNIIAPLLGGVRIACHPDPTDAPGLVRAIGGYRATHLVTTPTFLGYMFATTTTTNLQSLRVIVVGAEKCPEAIFARAAELAPEAALIEGYGITECSPVVAGNRVGQAMPGTVGRPMPSVEVCVVDPESGQPLPAGSTGILLVRGPSVFRGYLAYDGPDPFVDLDGHRWYQMGDLVRLDGEGFIHFQGRLKRFLKTGGEMISLPALEEPLIRLYPATEQGPQVAVEGVETAEGRWIVLFTTADIALRQANAAIAAAGFRGIMRLDEVVRLDAISVLGTGKTDYKLLRTLAAQRAEAAQHR